MKIYLGILLFSIISNFILAKIKKREKFIWVVLAIFLPILSTFILIFLKIIKTQINYEGSNVNSLCPAPIKKEEEKPAIPAFSIAGALKPLFIDVETTGLHSNDRIVSLCMISLDIEEIVREQKFKYSSIYRIFDPCKKSHKIAEGIHGFDDWTLRHQNLFEEESHEIIQLLDNADLIVGHNIKFDLRFLKNEIINSGLSFKEINSACTMEMFGGNLASCANLIGINRTGEIHNAYEDTAICMCLYLKKFSNINVSDLYSQIVIHDLQNFIEPPPRPEGALPRRNNVLKRKERLENKII